MDNAVIISLMVSQIALSLLAINSRNLLKKSWRREREAQETYDQLIESLNKVIEIQKETIETQKGHIALYEATQGELCLHQN